MRAPILTPIMMGRMPPIVIPGRIRLVKLAASITSAANPSAPVKRPF